MKKSFGMKQHQGNEPTDEELILFHKLLKSNNQDAKNTHDEYVKNQNKEQFYTKIINLCRNMNHVTTKEDGKPSQRREQNRRVCYLFPEGKCLRGNECKFEHIIDRHVEGDSHREKKDTKPVCMYYESGGVCKKADRCKFKHPNGVKEGNFWRNPSHSKQQNEVIEEEVIVQTTERKETEITETKISSPSLLSNQSSEYLNGDDAEEPVGRSLLRDSENQSDNSLPLDAVDNSANIKLDLDSSNANQEEGIRIFEFLVDHNVRPLLSTQTTSESDSLWMALNLGKISNGFEVFPQPENESTLLNPRTQDVDTPKANIPVKTQEPVNPENNALFGPESFAVHPVDAYQPPPPLFQPPLRNENDNSHRPVPFDRNFSNGLPGPEYPYYPPTSPHMMPHQVLPPFMMPGYHPGMYPPPHMMGIPPFPHFPGVFPPHMPPFLPPDSPHRAPNENVPPPHLHPRMPYPYGYPFPPPPPFYGDGALPPSPQFMEQTRNIPFETNSLRDSNLPSPKPENLESSSKTLNDEGMMLKGFENLSTSKDISQTNSRFHFEDSIDSLLPRDDEILGDKLNSSMPALISDIRPPQPEKNNDPKAQVLLSFLHSKEPNSQLQNNQKVEVPQPNLAEIKQDLSEVGEVVEVDGKEDQTPHVRLHRVTRNQLGRIRVLIQNLQVKSLESKVDESSILPGGQMLVSWELPLEIWRNSSSSLVVALTRLGSSSNSNNIVMKDLKGSRYIQQKINRVNPNSNDARGYVNEDKDHDVIVGEISFHAPKAAGYYVYRIFDNSSDEKRCMTLGTSTQFVVELRGKDVAINLKFAIDAIGKTKSDIGSLGALRNTFELMRSTGTPFQGRSPQSLIQECVQLVLEVIQKHIPILNERDDARRTQLLEKPHENPDDQEGKADSSNDALWQKARNAQKVHIAAHDCLTALRGNIIAWGMLTAPFKQNVATIMSQFCQFERRFFDNLRDMNSTRNMDFGFVPCPPLQSNMTSNAARTLSTTIHQRVGNLIPTSMDFYHRREEVRTRLRKQLCERSVIPSTADLVVFGSSRNNFGSDSADLDMCLQYSDVSTIPLGEQRATVMEALGAALTEMGMLDVQARSTARIPIVLFKDPISGLDCDISFNNPLAIRNTLLLASYSAIDTRVRELAFIIKYWAKQRYINNPQEGTLSSYGYILCLIHFLQIRNPMLVPNLQLIPPDWEPGRPLDRSLNLPKRWEKHPVEDCYCNTYYYDLTHKRELQKCQLISSNNHQSIGELLIEFFRYFAYEFDYHTNVISIRAGQKIITKLFKAETDCWGTHDRLSIEDPFETWYDVAHVIKGTQMSYMRKEFLRAYTLICRSCINDTTILGTTAPDSLPQTVPLTELFDILTATPAEIPKFAQAAKIARSRANTLVENGCESEAQA